MQQVKVQMEWDTKYGRQLDRIRFFNSILVTSSNFQLQKTRLFSIDMTLETSTDSNLSYYPVSASCLDLRVLSIQFADGRMVLLMLIDN
jgi:hypothetical protein